jgi:hypothetical protein
MTATELKWTNLPGPLVNFNTQEYMYTSIGNFIIHEEEFKDFVIIDEHIADVVMRCNSHGIKTYFCCAGHAIDEVFVDGCESPVYSSAYIVFEQKPIIKQMFINSKYWQFSECKAGFDQLPGYAIHIKRHDTFKDWAKAMKELQYKFSFLTNEFRQLLSY